jgi:hypothetical protein
MESSHRLSGGCRTYLSGTIQGLGSSGPGVYPTLLDMLDTIDKFSHNLGKYYYD